MIDFTQKTWVDYPDTSTPITATELNRMEQGITDACNGVNAAPTVNGMNQAITQFIINGINALHPEYTESRFSEQVEDESDKTMSCTVDLNVYNPDKSDGLLITADGVLVSPLGYTTSVENNAAVIRIGESAGLQVGQTVYFTVYHKTQISAGGKVSGTVISISDGTVSNSIADDAQEIADEEETE